MSEPGFRVVNKRTRRTSEIVTGQTVQQAKEFRDRALKDGRLPREGVVMPAVGDTSPFAQFSRHANQDEALDEMRRNRRVAMRKQGAGGGMVAGSGSAAVSMATGRPRDPMFYWRQNNLPYDVTRDEELKKIRAFCNTPDAPIWMGDYSFKPIGEVQPGDEVMGWVYNTGPGGQQRKRLVRSRVVATKRRMAPEVVRVTMESGRVIRCTPDHLWANPNFAPTQQPVVDRRIRKSTGEPANLTRTWRQPEYKSAQVGSQLVHVIDPTEPLTNEKDRLTAAWLSGVYDGEGCGNEIAQSEAHNPGVCQRIKDSLDALDLPWTAQHDRIFIRKAGQGYRRGAQQDLVNFLNWTDPVRRVTNANDKAILRRPGGGKDRVVSIESEGPGEVISMETETGNYVAWGYASKNCRILYLTHPLIPSCIDIFTKYPLQGAAFKCKDEQLVDFHSSLFFDQLDYRKYLPDVGREYWLTGEAWPMGSFNEELGVWDDDELLNPDDVEVEKSPFLKEPRFLIRLPESLRRVLRERAPRWEYQALVRDYPELINYVSEDALMPVSNMLLKQIRFKADTFHKRGIPILMRGFRTVVQEEMLNAAMDAIADRLYTPLILTKLGASATDLGTDKPWVPTAGDLMDFDEALDAALAADFRTLTHHFAVSMESVFGRENMPDLSADFDRIDERLLMVFGMSKTMISGAASGETYAADGLNKDVVTQLLTDYQGEMQDFVRDRTLIVAEAQEHYDYDERGGQRYVKMEEILVIDEETQESRIEQQPALLVPELTFDTMSLADEEGERNFLEVLADKGVPIPIRRRLMGMGVDFEEMIEQRRNEQVQLALAEQETRKDIYIALRDQNLPIPEDLVTDFRPIARTPGNGPVSSAGDMAIPSLGQDPMANPALAPTPEDLADDEDEQMAEGPMQQTGPGDNVILMPNAQQPGDQRPPESDEQRGAMPKPAKRIAKAAEFKRRTGVLYMRQIIAERHVPVDNSIEDAEIEHEDGSKTVVKHPENYRPSGKFGDPRVVGMRQHVEIPEAARWKPESDGASA